MTSMRRLAEGTPDDDEESYYTDEESSYTYEDVELTLARAIFVSLGYSNVGAAIDHVFVNYNKYQKPSDTEDEHDFEALRAMMKYAF